MATILSRFLTTYRIVRTLVFKNDLSRWKQVALVDPPWDERNQIIGGIIPDNCSVLDIGCGAQTLKRYLPKEVEYQPCDLVKREGVLFCDFNSGVYPVISKSYDYVVCSGVLEYSRNPSEFLRRMGGFGRTIILTYCHLSSGEKIWQRTSAGWVNHFTKEQLETLILQECFIWKKVGEWGHQRIYTLTRGQKE